MADVEGTAIYSIQAIYVNQTREQYSVIGLSSLPDLRLETFNELAVTTAALQEKFNGIGDNDTWAVIVTYRGNEVARYCPDSMRPDGDIPAIN